MILLKVTTSASPILLGDLKCSDKGWIAEVATDG